MTDCEFVLAELADGRERSLNSILAASFAKRGHGLTVHSRVADLRKRGYKIEHRTAGTRGAGSLYRLVGTLSEGEHKSGAGSSLTNPQTCSVDSRSGDVSASSPSLNVAEQLALIPAASGAYR